MGKKHVHSTTGWLRPSALRFTLAFALCFAMLFSNSFYLFEPIEVEAATTVPTEQQGYNALISMKSTYPEGMTWTNDNSYSGYYHYTNPGDKYGYYRNGQVIPYTSVIGYGCAGFAFHLSNVAFGDLPDREHTNWDNIRVGDILRINNNAHSVIVLNVSGDTITVAEGNYNSMIHWGRKISRKDLKAGQGTYIWTRWPDGSSTASTTTTTTTTTTTASANKVTTYNGVDYSAVYDPDYYLSKNGDLKAAYGTDYNALIAHFVNYGMKEGRQASANFNVQYYKNRYADLRAVYGSDLKLYYMHYINYGRAEKRDGKTYCAAPASTTTTKTTTTSNAGLTVYDGVDYSAVYNYTYYINNNPDVKAAFGSDQTAALRHFVTYGMNEGRQASASFNVVAYRANNGDVRAAFGNNLKAYYMHYINYGRKEGRNAVSASAAAIAAANAALNASSSTNTSAYSAVYDYNYYINKYGDLKAAFGNDQQAAYQHFLTYGMKEGRQASANFNVTNYKNRYGDLRAAYGNDLKSYYEHYINYGIKEGRNGK